MGGGGLHTSVHASVHMEFAELMESMEFAELVWFEVRILCSSGCVHRKGCTPWTKEYLAQYDINGKISVMHQSFVLILKFLLLLLLLFNPSYSEF